MVAMACPEEKGEPEIAAFLYQPLFGQKAGKIASFLQHLPLTPSPPTPYSPAHDLKYSADRFMVRHIPVA
jgi:hypothetical protein